MAVTEGFEPSVCAQVCPKCAHPVPRLTVQLRSLRGGFVERVSTGLAAVREFEDDEGLVFLEVASRCL